MPGRGMFRVGRIVSKSFRRRIFQPFGNAAKLPSGRFWSALGDATLSSLIASSAFSTSLVHHDQKGRRPEADGWNKGPLGREAFDDHLSADHTINAMQTAQRDEENEMIARTSFCAHSWVTANAITAAPMTIMSAAVTRAGGTYDGAAQLLYMSCMLALV
jgi:hypothetical protein